MEKGRREESGVAKGLGGEEMEEEKGRREEAEEEGGWEEA